MNNAIKVFAVALASVACTTCGGAIDLSGSWAFQLDPNDVGVREKWYDESLPERLHLPGALQSQGFGDDVTADTKWTGSSNEQIWLSQARYEKYRQPGHIKVPFCLQPEKHYVGAAWYQRQIEIPTPWRNKHAMLTLERPHWETRVWVDGACVGRDDSLCTPHEYDLGALTPGAHVLTIRVDNRVIVDVGEWSHSVSDHTQGNWNGIVGRIELSARGDVWIDDLQVVPHVATKSVTVMGRIVDASGKPGSATVTLAVEPCDSEWDEGGSGKRSLPMAIREASVPIAKTSGLDAATGPNLQSAMGSRIHVLWDTGGTFTAEIALGDDAQTWDEFHPALYRLTAVLDRPDTMRQVTFGLREVSTTPDKLFAVNGRKTFLRGTLECCIFPLTGHPPTDVEPWKRIIRICKTHGLNHIRFHSWCPPEAAFVAADELGFYYQVECGVWTNPGNGTPVDKWLWNESERIVRAYGNHPSFVLFASGNEPHGPKREEYLTKWVAHWKEKDPRRLCTTASAYPLLPVNEYHVDYHPRGPKGWGGKDYADEVKEHNVPAIVHEMGQWCVYPNFDEIEKYTGPLKPKNFEIFRDSLSEHGMLDQWRDFLCASGKLQVLCYKEEIEAALRTPGVGGIQLLDLHDFPGQGTALVGVLDAFWDGKGYVTPSEFRRFYDTTVPLARMEKRVWTSDESFSAEATVAHFGPAPLEDAVATWKLVNAAGETVMGGQWSARDIPVDRGVELGRISFEWERLPAPAQYRLVVGLQDTHFENDWRLWVYSPDVGPESGDVRVSSALDEPTLAHLADGGKILLMATTPPPEFPRGSFAPIFWNRFMFNTQQTQTLGLLCDPGHAALKRFPTDFHSDWQWAGILSKSHALVMDELPRGLRPIVQVIDDWNTNRKLGLLFECRLGRGKLLVCSAEIAGDLDTRPAARQLRRSLLDYMASDQFDPKVELTIEQLRSLYREPTLLERIGATVTADSAHDGYEARLAIDSNPVTIWHTRWSPNDPLPHHLVIDLSEAMRVFGLTYLPRQDMTNGRIADYEVYVSDDGKDWQRRAAGRWPNSADRKTVRFEQPVTARYLKLLALSEVSGQTFTSAAEVDVLLK